MEKESIRIQYIGPAKHIFNSFQDLATCFLDAFCPNWSNYENPQSYIIPRVFSFKRPEVSDEGMEKLLASRAQQSSTSHNSVITDRLGDSAEHVTYDIINAYANFGTFAPFVAVHGFKIDDRRIKLLKQIFPNVQWKGLECDFLLVGPKVGVVIIEIKGSLFNSKKDFSDEHHHLPGDYEKGLYQSMIVQDLLRQLERCVDLSLPASSPPVHRVIFTPNLERSRYMRWRSMMPEEDRRAIDEKTSTVYQMFKEDLNIVKKWKDDEHASGYAKIWQIPNFLKVLGNVLNTRIEELSLTEDEMFQFCRHPVDIVEWRVYEAYARIIVGLSSVVALDSKTNLRPVITLDQVSYSRQLAINTESMRIKHQNPIAESKNPQLHKDSLLKPIAKNEPMKEHLKSLSLIFLTPEQLLIVRGGNRRLFFGPAGTGKTLLLQAKALELLNQGQSVTVFASDWFKFRYKNLFDEYQLKNYRIREWESIAKYMTETDIDYMKKNSASKKEKRNFENFKEDLLANLKTFSDKCSKVLGGEDNALLADLQQLTESLPLHYFYTYLRRAISRDHIIFDDMDLFLSYQTNTERNINFITFSSLMTIIRTSDYDRLVWIAAHPTTSSIQSYSRYLQLIAESCQCPITHLTQIMRYSQNVHDLACPPRDLDTGSTLFPDSPWVREKPLLGHKIQGIMPIWSKQHFETANEAWEAVANKLPRIITELLDQTYETIEDNLIGVLFSFDASTDINHEYMKTVANFLISYFSKRNISVSYNFNTNAAKALYKPILSHKGRFPVSRDAITIDQTSFVASFEWPAVVHVVIGPSSDIRGEKMALFENCVYQARSRAMTTFLELFYTHDEEIEPADDEFSDADDEQIVSGSASIDSNASDDGDSEISSESEVESENDVETALDNHSESDAVAEFLNDFFRLVDNNGDVQSRNLEEDNFESEFKNQNDDAATKPKSKEIPHDYPHISLGRKKVKQKRLTLHGVNYSAKSYDNFSAISNPTGFP